MKSIAKTLHSTLFSVLLYNPQEKMMNSLAANNIRNKVYFTSNIKDKIQYKLKCEVN